VTTGKIDGWIGFRIQLMQIQVNYKKIFNICQPLEESRLFRESTDVFNMLVSIYGSKDLFVKEYQNLLAERLLSNGWERHIHSEFNYLETMKKRFTEGELNHCEV
jgi:hypothetical protein